MPTYSSKCNACGSKYEYIRTISTRNDTPVCCEASTEKTLDTPMVSAMAFTGHKGFFLPTAENNGRGTWIESGSQYNKYIRENNLMVGDEAKQEQERKSTQRAETVKKERRATVEAVVSKALNN